MNNTSDNDPLNSRSEHPYQGQEYLVDSPKIVKEYSEEEYSTSPDNKSETAEPPTSGVQSKQELDLVFRNDPTVYLSSIKMNCEAMLEDIVSTNQSAKSVSSFISIPAFIGFLSKLAFRGNHNFLSTHNLKPNKSGYIPGFDGLAYVQFLERFVLDNQAWQSCHVENDAGDLPGIATVFYCMVRCGLLHGATLYDSRNAFTGITVKLTHEDHPGKTLKDYDLELKKRGTAKPPIEIVLNAFDICNEFSHALSKMFAACNSDSDLLHSIQFVYKDEPTFSFYNARTFTIKESDP